MKMLGYSDMDSFQKAIDRATKAMISLGVNHYENIVPIQRDGKQDFKLKKFACYLVAMNGDTKKPEVAMAQAYFINQKEQLDLYLAGNNEIDRLIIRDELSEGIKSLSSTVKKYGLDNDSYANFYNAGLFGMYDMSSKQLANKRKITTGNIYEYMGRAELAANLFRVTQTEEKIKNENITGQSNLENAHYKVGRSVRQIVKENTGQNPESLKQEEKNT